MVLNPSDDPFAHVGAAASEEGELAVAYVPSGRGEVQLDGSGLAGQLEAEWYNPRAGGSLTHSS